MGSKEFIGVLLLCFCLQACVSARMSDRAADRFFRQQNWKAALDDLKEGLKDEEDGPDQLLYLLDLGLVAHTAGEFQTSNHYLLKAESIAEIKDYTSLANEAATL